MSTVGEVFEEAAAAAGQRQAEVTLVTNQGDGICGYATGVMDYLPGFYVPTGDRLRPAPLRFERDHLHCSHGTILFSDRFGASAPGTGQFGAAQDQPFTVKAANAVSISIAPTGDGDATSKSWDVHLDLPDPISRSFDFTAEVVGSVIMGSTPAIGMAENVDRAVNLISVRLLPEPERLH